jgi:queuine tRNA-ribosyltransferase
MTNAIQSQCLQKHPRLPARVTEVTTAHGSFTTPCFMPVGTFAAVNCMRPDELREAGTQILLGGNTYHMLVYPGLEVIQAAGSMHQMMGWQGPMLTDSGGFQVFSLSKNKKQCKIDDDGARFKHPHTGKVIHLNAKTSIQAQQIIGADIIMAFDQCTPEIGGRAIAEQAMERTHRWLSLSKEQHVRNPLSIIGKPQALFGIIQGGRFEDLRRQSTEIILQHELDGIAIGGESIGFDMQATRNILDWVIPMLPDNKTRYTMGVGLHPQDLIDVVAGGVDIFDCVAPTRNARHGALYHGHVVQDGDWLRFDEQGMERGRLLIKKQCYAKDQGPILENCRCYTCQHFSRAYLHILFKQKHALYTPLACIHNIHVMHQTCLNMQRCIQQHSMKSKDPVQSTNKDKTSP